MSAVLPTTEGRVPRMSYETHNRSITDATVANWERFAKAPSTEVVTKRLADLAKEWDMERTLELNASIAAATGLLLGLSVSSKWFALSFIVLGFLFQHALQGYCPPMVWFRAYGWRTAGEIEDEITALRLLHGRSALSAFSGGKSDKDKLLRETISNKHNTGRFAGEVHENVVESSSKEE